MTESELAAMRALLEEHTAATQRHMDVLGEHLTSQVGLIAEGHVLLATKLDSVAAEVSGHTRQLEIVTTQIRVLSADVGELKRGQAELREDVGELKRGQAELREDVGELKKGQAELREDVGELKRGQAELREDVGELKKGQASLQQELVEFRAEVVKEFKEVRAQIRLSYSELDGRLHTLEHEVQDLKGRMERMEARLSA